jgi:hypothetical protein
LGLGVSAYALTVKAYAVAAKVGVMRMPAIFAVAYSSNRCRSVRKTVAGKFHVKVY